MTKREIMEAAVRAEYPDAVFTDWINNRWGIELHFLPNGKSTEEYSVVILPGNNDPFIMTEF